MQKTDKVWQEHRTCCKVCWVHRSSSGRSPCQPDGTWPGCSSRPTSGISSCGIVTKHNVVDARRSLWSTCTPAAQPPTNHDIPQDPQGGKGANLGLEVAQFLLGLHILGTNTRVNVTDPNSFSRNIQKVECCCFFPLNSSDGTQRSCREQALRDFRCTSYPIRNRMNYMYPSSDPADFSTVFLILLMVHLGV